MREGEREYESIEHGCVLPVDGPDEATANTACGVYGSVNVLLQITGRRRTNSTIKTIAGQIIKGISHFTREIGRTHHETKR